MHIIHGTWIPDDTHEFTQRGAFYLWVETDTFTGTGKSRSRAGNVHPRHLTQTALATFLMEKLGLREPVSGALVRTLSTKYFLLPTAASALDHDPFLMFELRGLSREDLHAELVRSPLGHILSSALKSDDTPPVEPVESYYTRPAREPDALVASHKEFWTGARRLPASQAATSQTSVPALLIKKQGDYPPFWHKEVSFIRVMEHLYERVRTKNRQMK